MTIEHFNNHQYLNLETFRRNGQGVKTPVWFAQDGEALRIWTEAGSGKAKRIRREGSVRLTPSTAAGEPLGEWTSGTATVLESKEEVARTAALFRKKYGVMFNLFGLMGKMRRATYITITIIVQ